MTLVTEQPEGLDSTNALDNIDDDLRARCVAEHGPIERKDGESRYTRTMAVQAIWKQGEPEPPDADAPQPALFDDDGNPVDEAAGDEPTGERD